MCIAQTLIPSTPEELKDCGKDNYCYVPCSLTWWHTAHFVYHVFCAKHMHSSYAAALNIYGPYETAITKTPGSLWSECLLTTFSGTKHTGWPVECPGCLWDAVYQHQLSPARAQTQQSPWATAEGHTTKYSYQLLFKQVRRQINYCIKKKKGGGGMDN